MKEIIKKITVYNFDELSKEAQRVAIEDQSRFEAENFDVDFVYNDAMEVFKILGFSFDNEKQPFYYSGFSCQGDGACINKASYSYAKEGLKKIKEYAPMDEELHRIAALLQDLQAPVFFTFTANIQHSGHYYHERSMDIDADFQKGGYGSNIQAHVALVDFKDIVAKLCKWLYGRIENEYNCMTDDDNCIEMMKSEKYEFTADGKRYTE